jgi:hypothetical protein
MKSRFFAAVLRRLTLAEPRTNNLSLRFLLILFHG